MSTKTIEIEYTVDGQPNTLAFTVTLQKFNKFIDSTTPKSKVAPAHNFVRSCFDGDKAEIDKVLQAPGVALSLCGEIIEEYMPEVEVISKNSNGALEA